MGYLALASAAAGLACLALSGPGKYLALGLGLFAIGVGILGYRRGRRPKVRLSAAAGMALATIAVLLGGAKIALTLAAIDHLEKLLH